MAITATEKKAALKVLMAVAETIRECGEAPAGTLYAGLMNHVDIHGFEAIIRTLKNAGLVKESGHLLTWIGPMKKEAA